MKDKLFINFIKNESGATAIEYGLCVALLALGTIVAAGLLGAAINGRFDENIDAVQNANL